VIAKVPELSARGRLGDKPISCSRVNEFLIRNDSIRLSIYNQERRR
jgi:hypothetical protein